MSNHKYSLYSIIFLGITNHICKYENQNGYEPEYHNVIPKITSSHINLITFKNGEGEVIEINQKF
jgi:hypothetical protein